MSFAEAGTGTAPSIETGQRAGWIAQHFSGRPYRSIYGIPVSHLQVVWTPLSVLINGLILVVLLDTVHPTPLQWSSAFASAMERLREMEAWLLAPLADYFQAYAGRALPDWAGHLVLAYAVAGSAFALEARTFETTSSPGRMGISLFAAASWPLVLSYFVLDMLRRATVFNFVQEHSRFYRLYNVAVLVVFALMILANAVLIEGGNSINAPHAS